MSVYASIADHIRELVLTEICPAAEFDITPEESGLRVRISNTPRGSWADAFLEPLENDGGEQVTSVELPDGIPPIIDWFVLVNITTSNSAPLVIFRRVILNGSEMSIDNMRIDLGRPSPSDPLREVLREFCQHPMIPYAKLSGSCPSDTVPGDRQADPPVQRTRDRRLSAHYSRRCCCAAGYFLCHWFACRLLVIRLLWPGLETAPGDLKCLDSGPTPGVPDT